MRINGRELIVKRPGSDNWRCDFRINGRRIRDSLGTNTEAEAAAKALQLYARLSAGDADAHPEKAPRLTLSQALGTYWQDRGAFAKTADDIEHKGKVLIAELGGSTPVRDLSFRMLSDYIARRRMRKPKSGKGPLIERANASINREIEFLRTVLIHARDGGAAVPTIDWKRLALDEPENYQNVLSREAEDRFFEALRPDFWPMVEFALVSGMRLDNVISLRWEGQIDEDARQVTVHGKSKRPGGKPIVVPLTEAAMQIINGERGKHREFVFTYACKRNRHDPHTGTIQNKGERYPFTQTGWRREWDCARVAIGQPKLRFHDLRHTAATRVLVATGQLAVVQKMLGHSDIAMTARYAHVDTAQVREAMETAATLFRVRSRTPQKVSG
jgi:integrase